jgi:hypothetical protein
LLVCVESFARGGEVKLTNLLFSLPIPASLRSQKANWFFRFISKT